MRAATGSHALTLTATVALLVGCADWDNPTALADLQPVVEFEFSVAEVETLEEIEIHAHIMEGGSPLRLKEGLLEIELATGGPVRTVELHPEGDGYAAHVTFFQEGDYHIHLMGIAEQHHMMWEFGEHEQHVHRRHKLIGPYRVELAVAPAPPTEHTLGHIHILAFDTLLGGAAGAPAAGLTIDAEVVDPGLVETPLSVMEEAPGEYEAEYTFGAAGVYELHVAIDVGGQLLEEHFHIPVPAPEPTNGDTGGDGHEH